MSKRMMQELILEGLDCAHCSGKIEDQVGALPNVKNSSVNFITKTLTVEVEDPDAIEVILEQTRAIIKKIEPNVVISEKIINKSNRTVLILMGLCCSNCAAKIEHEITNLSGVVAASVDFVNRRLTIETKGKREMLEVIEEAKEIVKRIEPDVTVVIEEDKMARKRKKEYMLKGLSCADCAGRIELRVRSLSGIREATVDFAQSKLKVEYESSMEIEELFKEITEAIKKIEPQTEVLEIDRKRDNELEDSDAEESLRKIKRIRLGIGIALFATVTLFEFTYWAEFACYFLAYLLIGYDVLAQSLRNILRGQVFDENFLMSIATIGAFSIGEFPEGVAVMLFYQVGEYFQDLAVNRSRKSIRALMDIRPDFANLKSGDDTRRISPEDVEVGEIIIVKPGEKVPLDGVIIDGKSMMDTSALTGESVPREVEVGNEVLSGSINKNGVLTVQVTKAFGESTVSKILDLVQNASSKKAPTENFITKFAKYYTPVVVLVAAAIAVIPPLVLPGATFSDWLYRALVFLVISCPCALVISIPLGFFGGIGAASRAGVLIKGSNYLEALNNVEVVVFDKTGTLTKGVFNVTEINAIDMSPEELLEYAAYSESYSNHPIATSILKAYQKDIVKSDIENYDEVSGYGIKVSVRGKTILAGNSRLMKREGIAHAIPDVIGTVVYIALDGKYAGYILISDEIKEDSERTIRELKAIGVRETVMLTGDIKSVGEKVGQQLGLDKVYSELLPDQKVERLEALEREKTAKGKLVFVGDGINDAPVLAKADIGFAMGGLGSDAAIEAADVVIMTDEPSKIITAIRIAKRTRNIVFQNIALALIVKGVVLALGAGGLATMWEAVFADVGVSVVAILNAMRVMKSESIAPYQGAENRQSKLSEAVEATGQSSGA